MISGSSNLTDRRRLYAGASGWGEGFLDDPAASSSIGGSFATSLSARSRLRDRLAEARALAACIAAGVGSLSTAKDGLDPRALLAILASRVENTCDMTTSRCTDFLSYFCSTEAISSSMLFEAA